MVRHHGAEQNTVYRLQLSEVDDLALAGALRVNVCGQ